jgi:hypothetical protein
VDWFSGGWAQNHTRGARLRAAQSADFLREIDIYHSRDAIENDPHIKEFLRPPGMGWAAGTIIPDPSGDSLIFSGPERYWKVGGGALKREKEKPRRARALGAAAFDFAVKWYRRLRER